jgi:hypothetical protein
VIRVPDVPIGRLTGAWRHRVGTGRVDLPLIPSRHEITLVELAPIADEIPPWRDERRLPGRKAA